MRKLIDAAGFRADARRNATHLAELIAGHADWRTMRSRPGMALLQELSGLSRTTVQTWCRWMERAGGLLVVEEGTTPRYAPDRLRPGDANLAREWHLVTPAPAISWAPTHAYGENPFPGACEVLSGAGDGQGDEDRRSAPDSSQLGPVRGPGQQAVWPLGRNSQRRRDMLTAVQTLQRRHMVLRWLSARRCRSILRPWFRSHWTVADVLYALESAPDGTEHWHADRVRDPAGWLEHRMGFWLDAAGAPMPPRSAMLAGRAAEHRARVARDRAERAALGAGRSADYAGRAAAARAGLLAKLRAPRDPASGTATQAASRAPASENSRPTTSLLTVNIGY